MTTVGPKWAKIPNFSQVFPFRWEHVYIPVLPLQLIEFVNAPIPFIMGVNSYSLRQR